MPLHEHAREFGGAGIIRLPPASPDRLFITRILWSCSSKSCFA
jgi:hypothetical protein